MNREQIFNYLMDKFDEKNASYVILHSYELLPQRFDSDIDIAIDMPDIITSVKFLDNCLSGTDWRVVQYWRHENYAADCVISNNHEFLQVDFCIHYERNGRVILPVETLVKNRRKIKNFYVPCQVIEFIYIILKKVLKKQFSDGSKKQLPMLWREMNEESRNNVRGKLKDYLPQDMINDLLQKIENEKFDEIQLELLYKELLKTTSDFLANSHYFFFDVKRKLDRIINPTGLFIVLMGVDGSGKSTIANELIIRSEVSFRRIKHYHSRVRVLKDLSKVKSKNVNADYNKPHSKTRKSGKLVSALKFAYYFMDYKIGNYIITKAKIQSSLVLIERYYYDYYIDKIRYNINLSDGYLRFWQHFIKKPDVIYILTGDSQILCDRKNEITVSEINKQKERFERFFKNKNNVVFIDTTTQSIDECVSLMIEKNNDIMRGRRKW